MWIVAALLQKAIINQTQGDKLSTCIESSSKWKFLIVIVISWKICLVYRWHGRGATFSLRLWTGGTIILAPSDGVVCLNLKKESVNCYQILEATLKVKHWLTFFPSTSCPPGNLITASRVSGSSKVTKPKRRLLPVSLWYMIRTSLTSPKRLKKGQVRARYQNCTPSSLQFFTYWKYSLSDAASV